MYLNYGDSKHAPENWHVCAQFALAISNPDDPTHFIQSRAYTLLDSIPVCFADHPFATEQRHITASPQKSKIGVSPALWS